MCTCSFQECLYSLTEIFWEYSKDGSVKSKGFKEIYSLGVRFKTKVTSIGTQAYNVIWNYAGNYKKTALNLGIWVSEQSYISSSKFIIVVFQTACN